MKGKHFTQATRLQELKLFWYPHTRRNCLLRCFRPRVRLPLLKSLNWLLDPCIPSRAWLSCCFTLNWGHRKTKTCPTPQLPGSWLQQLQLQQKYIFCWCWRGFGELSSAHLGIDWHSLVWITKAFDLEWLLNLGIDWHQIGVLRCKGCLFLSNNYACLRSDVWASTWQGFIKLITA